MNYFYYRISDNSYKKEKLPGADKELCLRNCLETFKSDWDQPRKKTLTDTWRPEPPRFRILADNIQSVETRQMLEKITAEYEVPVRYTNKGNAGSLIWSIRNAIDELPPYSIVYFIEDDYLHRKDADLREGFTVSVGPDESVDYVSLFDHPDKYSSLYKNGEYCRIFKSVCGNYWKSTQSTTMTFASSVYTLKEDLDVWEKWTAEDHPQDHQIFTELTSHRGRLLLSPLPGRATHTDLAVSIGTRNMAVEDWAIDIAIEHLEKKILAKEMDASTTDVLESIKKQKGWERLKLLQALWVSLTEF